MEALRILMLFLLLTMLSSSLFGQQIRFQQQHSPTASSLRGLHVLNDTLAWASGAKGTILQTRDGGNKWLLLPVPDSLDFRSLWAFSAEEAIVASAGQPARVYHTLNGGMVWNLVYEDTTGLAFFGALHFVNEQKGWLLSDPVNGKILLLETKDRGKSWSPLDLPVPKEGEAFFAASNGSIALAGSQHAWIGTGGAAIRVLATTDAGRSWQVQKVPLQSLSAASGIYALTFANHTHGAAIGGAYDLPDDSRFTACFTTNGGKRWKLSRIPPRGYRSGIAHLPGKRTFVAVGTTGTDLSTDGGETWQALNNENISSIRFSPSGKRGWAVGAGGKIFIMFIN